MQPLLLVRHAEAQHHVQAITGGWTNSDLTEKGRRQASLLAARLSQELGNQPIHLGSSDLGRAVQTAEILGQSLGLKSQSYAGLRDLNNGIAAGKTHQEAKDHAITLSEPWPDWQPYPEAESWRQFFQRVTAFMESFTPTLKTPALLVSHAAVIHVIIAWWLQLDVESRTHFGLAPASLTVLKVNRWGEHSLERLNDTIHLSMGGMMDPIKLD